MTHVPRVLPKHLRALLVSSIESMSRLDVLLHLRANRGRALSATTLSRSLRMTRALVERHLAALCGRGFLTVSIGSDLLYAYEPTSSTADSALQELEDLLRENRPTVAAAFDDVVVKSR